MTRLKARIKALVAATGPISVADYMTLCLFDPEYGYYVRREPFGAEGDFITAPEVSQMFGELIGVWLYATWDAIGQPLPVTVAEIGPGRGTLMKDVLRTVSRLEPKLAGRADFALVETSERLTQIQKKTLDGTAARLAWHTTVDTVPEGPLVAVGNELFDAIPIRQYVRAGGQWRERTIGLDGGENLRFAAGAGTLDPSLLPADAAAARDGAIVELAPARTALMDAIAGRIAVNGGAGLFIDYGYLTPSVGDTLQALRKHRYEDVLANPGEADLTAHVDFEALAATARRHGLEAHRMNQRDFLLAMGLVERAGRLGANTDRSGREKIQSEVERLAGPDQMGNLFKVLIIMPRETAFLPFARSN